jgi:hypothetical protein
MRFVYPAIPIVLFLILKRPGNFNKTFILSCALAILIYLILSKRFWLALLATISGLVFAKLRWVELMRSFACRPYVFRQLIKEIKEHPFWGRGFYHGLGHPQEMVWIEETNYGWIWRHCDWLNIATYLGIFATVFILWFYIESLRKIRVRLALIPMLVIGIMCAFQINFFKMDRASIYLLTIGLSIKTGFEKRREMQ